MAEPTPLGRRLLDLIRLRDTTMHRVSQDAGLSPSTVRQWIYEPKISGRPKPENLLAVAKVLRADYAELLLLAGHPLPPETRAELGQLRILVERLHELQKLSPERATAVIEGMLYLIELLEHVEVDVESLKDEDPPSDDVSFSVEAAAVDGGGDAGIYRSPDPGGVRANDPAARTRAAARLAVRARLLRDL